MAINKDTVRGRRPLTHQLQCRLLEKPSSGAWHTVESFDNEVDANKTAVDRTRATVKYGTQLEYRVFPVGGAA